MYLVRSNVEHLVHIPHGARLVPGLNEVDDAIWEAACSTAVMAARIAQGHFEVVSAPSGKSDDSESFYESDLKSLKPAMALKLIKETLRKDLLEKWDAVETREAVKKAIAAQFKELEVPLPKDED